MKSKSIYASPLRVYILLGLLAVAGILAGLSLPISLFPNSTKPSVSVWAGYGSSTAEEFQRSYGNNLESRLRNASAFEVERVTASYDHSSLRMTVDFAWGEDPILAEQEVSRIVNGWSALLPKESRNSVSVWQDNENGGFYALSFFSESRSLDDLYSILKGSLEGRLSTVKDAGSPGLWNPVANDVQIKLRPDVLATLQVFPSDIDSAVNQALSTFNGGFVQYGLGSIPVQAPRSVQTLQDLGEIPVVTRKGRTVHLSDIADVNFGPQSYGNRIVKTSGSKSIILFASPKPGGNVKSMADDLNKIVEEVMPTLPKDIKYKTLVDPSAFIRSAVKNVFHEVAIGSLLAVSILFVFIGSLRNVATAAIEIPLSLLLAFLLMKFFHVNINLISLGGLALSAGMNVDASVVVMENIFRHFEPYKGQSLSFERKLAIVKEAVSEVQSAIISSTIASLVVFVPLLVTSGLSQAILGDLAKAVIFSHGFSAVVALILVPTVRLHIMSRSPLVQGEHSIFERYLLRLESLYESSLSKFMSRVATKWFVATFLILFLAVLISFVLPRLPQEIVGTPDSDMIWMGVRSHGNSKIKQMETLSDEVENRLLKEFEGKIDYTFTQINDPNSSWILAKLSNKKDMESVWHELEAKFTNTALLSFNISPWNPSELPIPNPPQLRVAITGENLVERRDVALELKDLLESKQLFDRVRTEPAIERKKTVKAVPDLNQWTRLSQSTSRLSVADVMDLSRVATEGRQISSMPIDGNEVEVNLKFSDDLVSTLEDVLSLPVGVDSKIVPLKSLMNIEVVEAPPPVYRLDGQEPYLVLGRLNESQKKNEVSIQKKAEAAINEWMQARQSAVAGKGSTTTVVIEDAAKDKTDAIRQLSYAVAASLLLIFVVLLIQFGSIVESLLVMTAVPLGFIGVMTSLYVFKSSLSLNSVLGVILLNGIAVNNSIILVDYIKRLYEQGATPVEAALRASRLRLRPILITSLTTVLGMIPIALGLGEGGKILQPLGIAVAGGLWISMMLTLFMVPALHVSYLEWSRRNA